MHLERHVHGCRTGFLRRGTKPNHAVDHTFPINSQLASTQLTARPDLVQIWSRCPPEWREQNLRSSPCGTRNRNLEMPVCKILGIDSVPTPVSDRRFQIDQSCLTECIYQLV